VTVLCCVHRVRHCHSLCERKIIIDDVTYGGERREEPPKQLTHATSTSTREPQFLAPLGFLGMSIPKEHPGDAGRKKKQKTALKGHTPHSGGAMRGSSTFVFFGLVAGVYVCYMSFGLIQERMYAHVISYSHSFSPNV
jgi:hypothetical protein